MSPLQARSLPRTTYSLAPSSARVELLEYYLVHYEDLGRCAQASLDWLARYAGVRRSVCLAVDNDGGMLVPVAGIGVSVGDLELFSWPLNDMRDPVVSALGAD